MARRERTTALPRHRPRPVRHDGSRRILGVDVSEHAMRLGILGLAAVLLVAVIGTLGWRIYDANIRHPKSVILSVGGEQVRLNYYADRLLPWLQENSASGTSTGVLEDQLVTKLEEEELIKLVAAERGITISDADINEGIASSIGVGTSSGTFDAVYRDKLKTLKMSDASYRRMIAASLANDRLLEQIRTELGSEGEQLELRTVVLPSQEEAEAVLARIKGGEDMGTIAQKESNHLESRQQDGVMQPEPESLLPENIRAAVAGKSAGELLGPVEVERNWWVFRIERRESIAYTEAQKDQLAQDELDRLVAEKRSNTSIKRSLDAKDVEWAEGQVS